MRARVRSNKPKLLYQNVQVIAVDFDGTVVTHEFPKIGRDIGAVPVLKELVRQGYRLILWTMRSGLELSDAINWFTQNDIALWDVNNNFTQKSWTDSRKVYAQLYIDDAALGAPLIYPKEGRPYMNWKVIAKLFGIKQQRKQK